MKGLQDLSGLHAAVADHARVVPRLDEDKLRVFLGLRPRAEVEAQAQRQSLIRQRRRLYRDHADFLNRGERR
jgi:hypothetical protein